MSGDFNEMAASELRWADDTLYEDNRSWTSLGNGNSDAPSHKKHASFEDFEDNLSYNMTTSGDESADDGYFKAHPSSPPSVFSSPGIRNLESNETLIRSQYASPHERNHVHFESPEMQSSHTFVSPPLPSKSAFTPVIEVVIQRIDASD